MNKKYNLFQISASVAILPLLTLPMIATSAAADPTTVVPAVQLNILTGGDDLRGGSVAYAEIRLRSGTVLPKVNLNSGTNWGNGSSNSASLPLPAGTTLGDLNAATVTISHDGAARNSLDGYDNWNVDSIRVATSRICETKISIAKGNGRPWMRFTGGKTFKSLAFRVPPTARTATPTALGLEIITGGDDLRGGSVAYAEIRLRNGTVLSKVNLNSGTNWGNNSTNLAALPLPTGTQLGDLATLTVSHDGAARNFPDGYDNWNVDTLSVNTPEICNDGITLAAPSGRPWMRFTGGKTFKTFTLRAR
jgi:hypothetical protein